MPTLSAHANTENTALVVLQEKGYQVWYEAGCDRYFAEKDGWDFSAVGAMELLGAVAVFEHLKPAEFEEYWWKRQSPKLRGNLPSQPHDFRSVMAKG